MKKEYVLRLILCYTLGIFGGHKFREKNYGMGIIYLFTGGLFMAGWVYDTIKFTYYVICKSDSQLIEIENKRIQRVADNKEKWSEIQKEQNEVRKQKYIEKNASKANEVIHCPKCRGTQISAHKKGFGLGKAVVGTVTFGLLAGAGFGMVGKNKIYLSCMHCGNQWKPKR